PAYNLMARHNHRLVEAMIDMGHWVGLHYDRGFSSASGQGHHQWMAWEAEALEALFNVQIHAISFHQPGPDVLQGHVDTGTRINTYDKAALKHFRYYSDSNRKLKLVAFGESSDLEAVTL